VYLCVYAYTHTRCTDGVLECEPRGRKRHLEGLKNPDGLNLGIYVKTRENGRNVKPILEHSRGGPRPRGSRPEGLATAA